MQTTPATLPWWRSRVIVGAAISAALKLLFVLFALLDIDVALSEKELQPAIEGLFLLVSFAGDFMAARARVVQKEAPPITLHKSGSGKSGATVAALAALFLVGGCTGTLPPPTAGPGALADSTTLDERGNMTVEIAYQLGAIALKAMLDNDALSDEAATVALQRERDAYRAVLAVRQAYDAGNATTYLPAVLAANDAITALLAALKRE